MKSAESISIATRAIRLVEAFCNEHQKNPQDLLPREGERISIELKSFAHFAVLTEHNKDWGAGTFLPENVAKNKLRLFVIADVRALPGTSRNNHLQGYGSWLWRNHAGSYAAVFDEYLIASKTPYSRVSQAEATTRLFLHELGHFVLHRDRLFHGEPPNTATLAHLAIAEMESEAWQFAYFILGLARGDRAKFSAPYGDSSWLDWP